MPEFLQFAFMRHAFVATTAIALMGSLVGYFVVLRRQAFASHALSNIGFAGAAGASLIGAEPMLGLLVFVMGAALVMALTGREMGERDISVGMILMFSLGLGALFINLYSANANAAIGILFGSVFGIDADQIRWIVVVSLVLLGGLATLFRPLRFASLNPEAARARGIPVRTIDTLFLLLVGAAAAIAVPVIGSLLSFAIFIGPAAAAQAWCPRIGAGLALTAALALTQSLGGLVLSYYANLPASSCIGALSFGCYALSRLTRRFA
ncbi:metal ABC transporter permease [Salinicola halophilus]|uniref:metal ABC transporter permease n=1 Tax=Salinicola halophilus TaxID=184065 RepID=UPI000DA172F9|nr:metal ABC transporter permease [Salinicola halophilus]